MLFRWFFTGRPGLYAKRLLGRDGKYRYMPIHDELTDDHIRAHMYGRVMLGSYPILEDNTTHWAAADFDGGNGNAFEHARVFVNALMRYDIRPLCNVSQSGKGVHVRVVFSDSRRSGTRPIHSAVARRFMLKIIEQTELPSYREGGAFDRVFPSQDYLRDADSIGNQIAMPFNKVAAEERGGSMLLDACFNRIPLKDSWDFLTEYKLIQMINLFDAAQEMGETCYIFECVDSDNNFLEASKYDGASRESMHARNKKFPRVKEQLEFMVRGCDFFRWVRENPGLSYGLWFALVSQLIPYDQVGGRGVFHGISAMDTGCDSKGHPRYSPESTDIQYDKALVTMRSSYSCERIAVEGWRCRWLGEGGFCTKFKSRDGRMARSPAFLPFFRGSEANNTRRDSASDAA
jgi:hypothetical protein